MSTLPLLYSARSLEKRPEKQGGIFALQTHNRSSSSTSKSMHLNVNSSSKVDSPELNELSRNNITNYYFNNTARHSHASHSRRSSRKSVFVGDSSSGRYAKASFSRDSQKQGNMIMVGPDTIGARVNEHNEIQSVGTLYKGICTSILLFKTILRSSSSQLSQLHQNIQKTTKNISCQLQQLQKQIQQRSEYLYKKISECRRETLMQQKVNSMQVQKLIEDTENSKTIVNKIQQKIIYLKKQCNC